MVTKAVAAYKLKDTRQTVHIGGKDVASNHQVVTLRDRKQAHTDISFGAPSSKA